MGTMAHGLIQLPVHLGKAEHEIGDRAEDAEAKEEADKQRRKIQNRKNQRAHRQRLKGSKDKGGKDRGPGQTPRPFKVTRWRLDELEPDEDVRPPDETSPASEGSSATDTSPRSLRISSTGGSSPLLEHTIIPHGSHQTTTNSHIGPFPAPDHRHQPPFTVTFPLSSDHLLHLIHYNVLRALLTNKFSLNITYAGDDRAGISACPISEEYRHAGDTSPSIIPPSLAPTPLQKNHNHPIWVNAIPFPRIRDNFIRHAGLFNPWDLVYDLVGDFMSSTPDACVAGVPRPKTRPAPPPAAPRRSRGDYVDGGGGDDDDEVTAGRRGLIVWGEPHDARSWEATPGFLARWAWAVEGCEGELVAASNRWRVRRGEEPLRLSSFVR